MAQPQPPVKRRASKEKNLFDKFQTGIKQLQSGDRTRFVVTLDMADEKVSKDGFRFGLGLHHTKADSHGYISGSEQN